MRLVGRHEVLESVFVEMEPVQHGFRGVLVELLGEGNVLLETAAGTGNRLLEFRTRRLRLAGFLFEAELGMASYPGRGSNGKSFDR